MKRPQWLHPALLAGLLYLPFWLGAAEVSVPFTVTIRLGEICRSGAWSEKTQAEVKVVCSSSEFVSIEPTPGKRFLGTHGTADRFHIVATALPSGALMANADAFLGAGTVTSLRVYNISSNDGLLEMLVSF